MYRYKKIAVIFFVWLLTAISVGMAKEAFHVWVPDNIKQTALTEAQDVAIAADGSVYVLTLESIKKLDSSGKLLKEWGSWGSADGQFDGPSGITTDSSGNVYVADTYNHRIQKFTSDGAFLSKWGSYGSSDG